MRRKSGLRTGRIVRNSKAKYPPLCLYLLLCVFNPYVKQHGKVVERVSPRICYYLFNISITKQTEDGIMRLILNFLHHNHHAMGWMANKWTSPLRNMYWGTDIHPFIHVSSLPEKREINLMKGTVFCGMLCVDFNFNVNKMPVKLGLNVCLWRVE